MHALVLQNWDVVKTLCFWNVFLSSGQKQYICQYSIWNFMETHEFKNKDQNHVHKPNWQPPREYTIIIYVLPDNVWTFVKKAKKIKRQKTKKSNTSGCVTQQVKCHNYLEFFLIWMIFLYHVSFVAWVAQPTSNMKVWNSKANIRCNTETVCGHFASSEERTLHMNIVNNELMKKHGL